MFIINYLSVVFILANFSRIFSQNVSGRNCIFEDGTPGCCKRLGLCVTALIDEDFREKEIQSARCGQNDGSEEILCCPLSLSDGYFGEDHDSRPADFACIQYDLHGANFVPTVVNGRRAKSKDFPFLAALGYPDDKNSSNKLKFNCGGSIITSNYILTAAHCVYNLENYVPIAVRVGSENVTDDSPNAQLINIANITVHPKYNLKTHYNDIAIIKLDTHLNWTATILPICLSIEPRNEVELQSDSSFIVAGWGTTDVGSPSGILMQAQDLQLVSTNECNPHYAYLRQLPDGLTEDTICVIDRNETRRGDACRGDSGGPLIHKRFTTIARLFGITSFGQGCGGSIPGVYTSIYNYLDWIESIVWPGPRNYCIFA